MTREGWIFTSVMGALAAIGVVLLYITPFWDQGAGVPDGTAVRVPTPRLDARPLVPLSERITSTPVPEDRSEPPEDAPNVVVVLLAAQRRDQWSVYGHASPTTPFLSTRADGGLVFDDVVATSVDPRTVASALVTGAFPHRHGAVELANTDNERQTSPDATTLAERFATAGWATMGMTASHHYNAEAGLAQGFDWYRNAQPNAYMTERRETASQLAGAVVHRVGANRELWGDRPIYVQVSLIDTHRPLSITDEQAERFSDPEPVGARYRAAVRIIDDALQKLVAGLEDQGLTLDNTIFVVVGEHGEGLSMPEWHREQHGYVLYESSTRVPWMMWGMNIPSGVRESRLASSVDVAATVAGFAGLPPADGDGMDLSKAVAASSAWPRTNAYSETRFRGVYRASMWTSTRQCQQDFGTTKSIANDRFEDACYDRIDDPDFSTPIDGGDLMGELEDMYAMLSSVAREQSAAPPAGAKE